jgi:hypothetical protein
LSEVKPGRKPCWKKALAVVVRFGHHFRDSGDAGHVRFHIPRQSLNDPDRGLWENWKEPTSGEWIRTFAVITTDANVLVAEIHDRMPLILAPSDCARWLSDEADPRDLMRPFPATPMRMWPISTRVNKPKNDDPSIVELVELATSAA